MKICPKAIDYLIALDAPNSINCFDDIWLIKQVLKNPKTYTWLMESLAWLGEEFLAKIA
jgi:hypothetical protein